MTADDTAPLERLSAARSIAKASLEPAQCVSVAAALKDVGALELPALIGAFARIEEPDAQLGAKVIAGLMASPGVAGLSSTQLQQALARFPNETRTGAAAIVKAGADDAEMSSRIKAVTKQLVSGNAEHGKNVFFSNRAACSVCHRVASEGGKIGPDLSTIGRIRNRQDLLESILFPSSSIVNNFETYSVITTDGRTRQGVIHRSTSNHLVLRNTQRQEIVIPRDDIEELVRSKISIMPQGLDRAIRIEELSDLLAYLESLKP